MLPRTIPCTFFLLAAVTYSMAAATEEKITLWPEGAPHAKGSDDSDKPNLTVYPADADKRTGASIVICPGGGYGHLAVGHEGEEIGHWLSSIGVTGFVLRYRHGEKYPHPAPLLDAQRAIRTVRTRAKEFQVDPNRIGILGFSAGGHLASTAATHFDEGLTTSSDPIEKASCRPDFAVLCYAVISFTDESIAHKGSRKRLLGEDPSPEMIKFLSNELQVTAKTPPTFLWHTSEDKGVPPGNSISFYQACVKAGVPAEMHIYEKGPHGIGLGKKIATTGQWSLQCEAWMRERGLLNK